MIGQQNPTPPPEPAPSRGQGDAAKGPEVGPRADPGPGPSPAQPTFGTPAQQPTEAAPAPEEVLWVGRTSWRHFAGLIAIWSLASVLLAALVGWLAAKSEPLSGSVAFWLVLVLILVPGACVAARVIRGVLGQRYRLTNERLFIERGILSRTIDQTELIRVDDVRVHKSFVNMMLGLGSVEILSTDVSDRTIRLEGIDQSEQVAEAIRNCMRSLRKRSLFVEGL